MASLRDGQGGAGTITPWSGDQLAMCDLEGVEGVELVIDGTRETQLYFNENCYFTHTHTQKECVSCSVP